MVRNLGRHVEPLGKISARTMEEVVYRNLGAKRGEVLTGPRKGLDNAVVSLPGNRVLIVTADPVSMIPGLGAKTSAWLSVHLIASDYTTSGTKPRFATFTFNFPPAMRTSDRESYLREIGRSCKDLGISIVAGHTGSYPGASLTVIGGGTMFGFARKEGYVDSSMASRGDAILMTKGAAIEAAASLANSFPRYTTQMVGVSLSRRARGLVTSCSTVEDALVAASVGLGGEGISSMHDATEGGVLGALDEMASACGKSFIVEPGDIPVLPEASAVCSAFGLDPFRTMAEGSLLLTCLPAAVGELRGLLSRAGIPATEIGTVGEGRGLWLSGRAGGRRRFKPDPDGYWAAYERASRQRAE